MNAYPRQRAMVSAAIAFVTGYAMWRLARPCRVEGMTAGEEVRRELKRLEQRVRELVAKAAGASGGTSLRGNRGKSGDRGDWGNRGKSGDRGDRGNRGKSGRSGDRSGSGDRGSWGTGKLTYFWADEPDVGNGTGSLGAGGKKLVPMRSVAVKKALWKKYEGRSVEIDGMGTFSVDDYCDDTHGGDCKDIDLYVGKTQGGHDGIKSIRYRFL